MSPDSDIIVHPYRAPGDDTESEITRVFEIRTKQTDERPRYWNGNDFSTKAEEVKQFENRPDAELELSGLRAGAYIVEVGLG